MTASAPAPLGLIAGNGSFPFLVLRAARALGRRVTVVAIDGEASPDLDRMATELDGVSLRRISLGQLGECIATFRAAGVTEAVMAGQVKHVKLFTDVAPDPALAAALGALKTQNTDALISAIADAMLAGGIRLLDSTALLGESVAGVGVLSSAAPTPAMLQDFAFGYRIADEVARLDIGQTVVVKACAVVAVEAMEGTDVVIARAGALAGHGTRVVKVAKPQQDMRFDVPVVGVATIRAMQAAGADALSIDAGRTLMIDGRAVIEAADAAGIVVVGRARP